MHLILLLAVLIEAGSTSPQSHRFESSGGGGLIDATLVINDDRTYRYLNQTGSCWIDWDDQGYWNEEDDGLIVLTSDNLRNWSRASFIAAKGDESGLLINVRDQDGRALKGVLIRLGDGSLEKSSDASGTVRFDEGELRLVSGSREWVAYVTETDSGFVRLQRGSWIMKVGSVTPDAARVTYFVRVGDNLKQLGGLNITFMPCP